VDDAEFFQDIGFLLKSAATKYNTNPLLSFR